MLELRDLLVVIVLEVELLEPVDLIELLGEVGCTELLELELLEPVDLIELLGEVGCTELELELLDEVECTELLEPDDLIELLDEVACTEPELVDDG